MDSKIQGRPPQSEAVTGKTTYLKELKGFVRPVLLLGLSYSGYQNIILKRAGNPELKTAVATF
jgi:hypothetical protein